VLGLTGLLLFACSGEDPTDPDDPVCMELEAPEDGPTTAGARFTASISVVDTRTFAEDSAGARTEATVGRITGSFSDLQGVGTSTPAQALELGERCIGIVSRPTNATPTGVTIDRLVVGGTARGDIEVNAVATPGLYLDVGAGLLAGATEVSATVSSSGALPGFAASIAPAAPVVVESPVSDGTGTVDRAGMRVRWNAGNGDAIVIRINPEQTMGGVESGGQVICQVVDDGCFDVPAAATTFLLSSNTEKYGFLLSRVRSVGQEVDGMTRAVLRTASEWSTDLANGVFE
jgi:hypothetical protein